MIRDGIDPRLTLGAVHLTVADLERCIAFYTGRLGFRLRRREPDVAHLSAGEEDLLVLWRVPGASRVRGTTGLYHFAILVPSRAELGGVVGHLLATRTPLSGASDHAVSEAIYLSDPEGNGIEVYRDRPRSEWPLDGSGVRMISDPLDLEDLLAERMPGAPPWSRLPAGTRIGHVHLQVADLEIADRFYVGALGFERTMRLASALFVAAGGYHHHIGLNTWGGGGAPPPPPGSAGLRAFVLELPDPAARERVVARARAASVPVTQGEKGVVLEDPFANRIVLASSAGGTPPADG